MVRAVIAAVILVLSCVAPASAQQKGKVGLAMGYPASLAILWHPSERVALRPDFTFTKGSNESESGSTTVTGHGWGIAFGMSGLIYLSQEENLRTYVAPRFGYARTTNTSEAPSLANPTSKNTANNYQFAGSFGAQYAVHPKFTIYGEVGLAYTTTDSTYKGSISTGGKTSSNAWGLRGAAGVVFYLGQQ